LILLITDARMLSWRIKDKVRVEWKPKKAKERGEIKRGVPTPNLKVIEKEDVWSLDQRARESQADDFALQVSKERERDRDRDEIENEENVNG
jgi:hypothetical protein